MSSSAPIKDSAPAKGSRVTSSEQYSILIVDDAELNRSMLIDMLGGDDNYLFIEAEDGEEAIALLEQPETKVDLVLLDITMPKIDGFGVLTAMNESGMIRAVPVIMISSESAASYIEKSYDLGAIDYISRPFLPAAVKRRVENTLLLFSKQKRLEELVVVQMEERDRSSSLMVDILSNIVEFRNDESGLHVLRIRIITKILLEALMDRYPQYNITPSDVLLITEASALHDIGKIVVPEEILNKPGSLTAEEFEVMKTHTNKASDMLDRVAAKQSEPLMEVAHEICRWHHERFDGHGYPDGLKGDEIPLSAQVVSLADVYDALVSERVYKPPFTHEKAIEMIFDGECGIFNPDLLECLTAVEADLEQNIRFRAQYGDYSMESRIVTQELVSRKKTDASKRTLMLLEQERTKYQFLASLSNDILFEYNLETDILTVSEDGATLWGHDPVIVGAFGRPGQLKSFEPEDLAALKQDIEKTTPENPIVDKRILLNMASGEKKWYSITIKTLWTVGEPQERVGSIGRASDVHTSVLELEGLKRLSQEDPLTKLLNRNAARDVVDTRLSQMQEGSMAALIMMDVDDFKCVNDTRGHAFGDSVLAYLSSILKNTFRENDVLARIGGDEFVVYIDGIENKEVINALTKRLSTAFSVQYSDLPIGVSFGISLAPQDGNDFKSLLLAADQALYSTKRTGKNNWTFYSSETVGFKTVVSEID